MFFRSLPEKTWRQLLHYHVFPLTSRKNMTVTLALSCFSTRFQKKHDDNSCTIMFFHSLPEKTWRPLLHKHVFLLISEKSMMIASTHVCFSWKSPKNMITASIEKQKNRENICWFHNFLYEGSLTAMLKMRIPQAFYNTVGSPVQTPATLRIADKNINFTRKKAPKTVKYIQINSR